MNKFILLLSIILIPYFLSSQVTFKNFEKTESNNIEAFYLPESDTIGLLLFDYIKGFCTDTLWNSYELENITIFEVLSESNGWFKIKTTYYTKEVTGWVKPLHLKVRVGQIEESMLLKMEPKISSENAMEFTGKYYATLMKISGEWVQVRFYQIIKNWQKDGYLNPLVGTHTPIAINYNVH